MKLKFNLEYQTTFGEELMLNILKGNTDQPKPDVEKHKMVTYDGLHWTCELNKSVKATTHVDYYYSVHRGDEQTRHEWLVVPHRLEFVAERPVAIWSMTTGSTFQKTVICTLPHSPSAYLPALEK